MICQESAPVAAAVFRVQVGSTAAGDNKIILFRQESFSPLSSPGRTASTADYRHAMIERVYQ
jgi:hypothetical protein